MVDDLENEIDISFVYTIGLLSSGRSSYKLPQSLKNMQNAARTAIEEQVRNFRDTNLKAGVVCEITGVSLSRDCSHVDHCSPQTFDALLSAFCEQESLHSDAVEVDSKYGVIPVFADKTLASEWSEYHAEHAKLRLLSPAAHRALKKQKYNWRELLESLEWTL